MKIRMQILALLLLAKLSSPDNPEEYQFTVREIEKKVGCTYLTAWRNLDYLKDAGYLTKKSIKRSSRHINRFWMSDTTMNELQELPEKWITKYFMDVISW